MNLSLHWRTRYFEVFFVRYSILRKQSVEIFFLSYSVRSELKPYDLAYRIRKKIYITYNYKRCEYVIMKNLHT